MSKPLTSDEMALLETCCGCSLAVSSAVLGVYLLVAYLIAFTIELWWILDPSVTAPVPAYLLCLGYFVLFGFSAILLHGLSIKKTTFLLLWLFMMGILLGPEAGLVLYMSIHYWKITSINGLIEITCWACRLLVNATGILCVQSLHSNWREEKSVLLRLEALKTQTPLHKISDSIDPRRGKIMRVPSMIKSYNNQGYDDDDDDEDNGKNDFDSMKLSESKTSEDISLRDREPRGGDDNIENEEVFQNGFYDPLYPLPCIDSAFNEFNAFSFDPSVIDARLPYLTIRQKPKMFSDAPRRLKIPNFSESFVKPQIIPKTNSLLDLSTDKLKNVEVVNFHGHRMSPPLGVPNYLPFPDEDDEDDGSGDPKNRDNVTENKDLKIIKNKNFKIFKKLSPFCRKKSNEIVNVYHINPSRRLAKNVHEQNMSSLDTQLNRIYQSRGMYAFEEKTRKVVFYPPEFFQGFRGQGFRGFRLSSSTLSQSSIDSEDIKQISDVAL